MGDADGLLNEDLDFPGTLFVSIIKNLPTLLFLLFSNYKTSYQ